MKVLLIGAGPMAIDYAKVLDGLDVSFVTVGMSENKCRKFEQMTKHVAIPGGIENYLNDDNDFTHAIISTTAETLASISCLVMRKGIKNVLTEKPGGLSKKEIQQICNIQDETDSSVYIGYNRRLYASVLRAREIIQEDGGVKSLNFEFTEWPHVVRESGLPEKTTRSWFLCNSTHVIDMAFYLGGYPTTISSLTQGTMEWTDDKIVFCGNGKTDKDALFSYNANWNAPGRWRVEVLTERHRLIFCPLEKLQIQALKTVKIEFDESVDYECDIKYKPGLYREVRAFLGKCPEDLCLMKTMQQQLQMFDLYSKISGREY